MSFIRFLSSEAAIQVFIYYLTYSIAVSVSSIQNVRLILEIITIAYHITSERMLELHIKFSMMQCNNTYLDWVNRTEQKLWADACLDLIIEWF